MNDMLPLHWRRSTYRGPDQINCVELAAVVNPDRAAWGESTHRGGRGDCAELTVLADADGGVRYQSAHDGTGHGGHVESAAAGDVLAVRDGEDPDGPVLLLDLHAATAFLTSVKMGEYDR